MAEQTPDPLAYLDCLDKDIARMVETYGLKSQQATNALLLNIARQLDRLMPELLK